jgi:hypothetical protein
MSWVTEDTRAHGAQELPGGISEDTGKWAAGKVKRQALWNAYFATPSACLILNLPKIGKLLI